MIIEVAWLSPLSAAASNLPISPNVAPRLLPVARAWMTTGRSVATLDESSASWTWFASTSLGTSCLV